MKIKINSQEKNVNFLQDNIYSPIKSILEDNNIYNTKYINESNKKIKIINNNISKVLLLLKNAKSSKIKLSNKLDKLTDANKKTIDLISSQLGIV